MSRDYGRLCVTSCRGGYGMASMMPCGVGVVSIDGLYVRMVSFCMGDVLCGIADSTSYCIAEVHVVSPYHVVSVSCQTVKLVVDDVTYRPMISHRIT